MKPRKRKTNIFNLQTLQRIDKLTKTVPFATTIPNWVVYKGDGKSKTFRLPDDKQIVIKGVTVLHTRGGKDRTPPSAIYKRKITFDKPPQKGNKICIVYEYNPRDKT